MTDIPEYTLGCRACTPALGHSSGNHHGTAGHICGHWQGHICGAGHTDLTCLEQFSLNAGAQHGLRVWIRSKDTFPEARTSQEQRGGIGERAGLGAQRVLDVRALAGHSAAWRRRHGCFQH